MITVCGDRILIKPLELKKEHKVAGTEVSIALAYGNTEKQHEAATTEGHVIGLGQLAYKDVGDGSPWVKTGDYVLYGKYAGFHITDPETKENLVILADTDILCVINQGEVK